jgi:Fungalysin metallopeptidase (M36)/PA domain/Fungalysin/Thermolysin Propeptide Motif
MKRILLLAFSVLLLTASWGQNDNQYNRAFALQLVKENKEAIGFSDNDIFNTTVSSSYTVTGTGMTMVYLQQTYLGIPVLNKMKVLAFVQGKLVSNAGTLVQDMGKATTGYSAAPSISTNDAVRLAFAEQQLPMPAITTAVTSQNGRLINYGKPAGISEDITAELMWFPVEKDGQVSVKLGWQVQVATFGKDDVWHIRIDALNGKLIEKINIVIYENFHSGHKNEKAGYIETGSGIKKYTGILNSNNGIAERQQSPNAIANANYLVIPYPIEAPSFGVATVRNNPWTAAPGNATTLGWHSTGTTDYTISRGNNVWATEDTFGANQNVGLPATSTTAPDPLNFNFTPNYNVEPSKNPTMQQFAITNLFYWNNIIHDITYQYGFDEVAGNYQQNNQGRGGQGSDYVTALAQSGAAGHIGNNANFLPTVDGVSGRMRMYLFSPRSPATVRVNSPVSIAGDYLATESNFSLNNKLEVLGPVTGQLIYFNDNVAGTTHEACGTAANTLTGKIVMIDRGNCNFTQKVLTAQNAGAIAAVVVNNTTGYVNMGGDDNTITIPAVSISQADGAIFAAQLANNVNVTLRYNPPIDGDLDNGVVVHEYAHGISNRLTGGPATASCMQNAERGGEGWSDYFALMLTTNWLTTNVTDGTIARTVATYANAEAPNGGGFRNYPYTTSMTLNPLTYANVGVPGPQWLLIPQLPLLPETEVHNIGEVWCNALWEMTWGIIQQENSINTNLYNFSLTNTGGNSIAFKLVMEGMRLQPCNPGYIDARNAILTADMNLYAGRHQCAIWTAFAKRGMGYSALQGSANSATDQTAAFDLPPAATITTQPVDLTVNPGNNAVFTVAATPPINGAYLVYTWQRSIDGGTTWNDIAPAVTTPTLTLTAVTALMNGFKYRCIIRQGCASTTSSVATLTVFVPSGFTFTTPPPATSACPAPTTMDIVLGTTVIGGFANPITVSSSTPPAGTTVSFVPGNTVTPGNNVTVRLTGTNTLVPGTYVLTITGTATGATTQTRDITYTITAGTAPAITAQPANQTVCAGTNTSFSITSNTATSFLWQISTDGGITWTTITNGGVYSGATTATLNITGATVALNNNRYRCIASTVCGSSTSNAGILTVNTAPAITSQPTSASACAGTNQTFTVAATGSSLTYQWYISTDGGGTFNILSNGGVYSGATSASLTITGVTAGLNNNQYRCVVTGVCPVSPLTSNAATLTVPSALNITSQPASATICAGSNTSFTVAGTGIDTYQWQISTDGGTTWTNVSNGGVYSGATTATLTITGATGALNNNRYRCNVSSAACGTVSSTGAILTVNTAPVITTQPTNASVCTGANHTFTVGTTGTSLTYQWFMSTDGGATFNILPNGGVYSGATSASLTITGVTAVLNNNQYRCVVTGVCPLSPLTTNAVTISVASALSITGQPVAATICAGTNTSFAVTAVGAGNYQWQVSTDGGATYTDVANGGVYSGATTATLNLTAVPVTFNGNRYRCNLSSSCGNATTSSVLLTVNALPTITAQPTNATLCAGSNNTFSVTATGGSLTYQWQVSTNGCAGPWTDIPAATSASYTLTGIAAVLNNTAYRCVVSGACAPAATSNCALLTVVTPATITASPTNQTICEGSNTSFTVTGSGAGIIYQWQVSTDGGVTYTNVSNGGVYSGATTATLSITAATASLNNNRYRCQASNATCTTPATSNAAILTVNTLPTISAQPQNAVICTSGNNTFSVTATGTGITYQWQVSITGCGGTWVNVSNGGVYSGATTAALTITAAPVTMNGYAYRCVITGTCTPAATSNCVSLSVGSAVTITTQPTDQVVCSGSNPSFTVAGSGTGVLYQWQVSTDGGTTWTNITGATLATYTLTGATVAANNSRYRCLLSNATCTVPATSAVAVLTVRQLPTVGLTAVSLTALLPGQTTTLTATPSASAGGVLTTSWFKDGLALPNPGSTYIADISRLGAYQVRIQETFAGGLTCSNQSAIVTISAAISNKVFIFPSPNDGQFTVSYYNNGGASATRTVTVYDSKGARIYNAKFPVTGFYTLLPVDLRPAQRGIYYVVIGDDTGKKMADGKVMVNW